MSDPVSALPDVRFEGAVIVEECGLRGMVTLRADLDSDKLAAAVKTATALAVPKARKVSTGANASVAWMSPDELLLMVDYNKAEATVASLAKSLKGTHHLAVNVSDARAVFAIHGAGAREVLAKGAPVDLSPDAFQPGEIRRTRVGQIAAAFWLTGEDAFELVCFRSVAGFMFDWLRTAALTGSLPGHFRGREK